MNETSFNVASFNRKARTAVKSSRHCRIVLLLLLDNYRDGSELTHLPELEGLQLRSLGVRVRTQQSPQSFPFSTSLFKDVSEVFCVNKLVSFKITHNKDLFIILFFLLCFLWLKKVI